MLPSIVPYTVDGGHRISEGNASFFELQAPTFGRRRASNDVAAIITVAQFLHLWLYYKNGYKHAKLHPNLIPTRARLGD
jgi:hypothetical protein